jgi:hypothetical protein
MTWEASRREAPVQIDALALIGSPHDLSHRRVELGPVTSDHRAQTAVDDDRLAGQVARPDDPDADVGDVVGRRGRWSGEAAATSSRWASQPSVHGVSTRPTCHIRWTSAWNTVRSLLADEMSGMGVQLRAGLHTGDIERRR